MNSVNRKSIGLARALCLDAFGNLSAGQEARAFGFLREAIALLRAIESCADAKGHVRAESELQVALSAAVKAADQMQPAFNNEIVATSRERVEAMGIDVGSVLTAV